MKTSVTERALANIDAKIETLRAAKQHILDAHKELGAPAESDEPKVRKTRKRRSAGLPSATPPPSEANLVGRL